MYTKQISTVLKNIVIFTRNVEKTAAFYSNALGLKISSQSTQLVELKDTNNTRILLKKVDGEAFVNKGYSPLLNFHVDNIEKTIEEIKSYGGNLDGEIITEEDFKLACLRAPDGEMIGLYEGKADESDSDQDKGGLSDVMDKTTQEIKNILRKIQF